MVNVWNKTAEHYARRVQELAAAGDVSRAAQLVDKANFCRLQALAAAAKAAMVERRK